MQPMSIKKQDGAGIFLWFSEITY